jgi:hypothetical protein
VDALAYSCEQASQFRSGLPDYVEQGPALFIPGREPW